jgi:hypothetical protein
MTGMTHRQIGFAIMVKRVVDRREKLAAAISLAANSHPGS